MSDRVDGLNREFHRVSGLAPEHFCPSDPAYGQELKDRQIADVLAELATLVDLHDYSTGDYIRQATAAEAQASREAAELDGGAGVILIDDQDRILRADDRGADEARRCYVS